MGLEDAYFFITYLKQGLETNSVKSGSPSLNFSNAYATFPSGLFDQKEYTFASNENNYGRFLAIQEIRPDGLGSKKTTTVIIAHEHVQEVITELEKLVSYGENRNRGSDD